MTPIHLPTATPEAEAIGDSPDKRGDSPDSSVFQPGSLPQAASGSDGPVALKQGKLIVFTGPSGVGKGTILRELLKRHPELTLSISATTRNPREGEVDGQHYYFIERNRFQRLIEEGELLEWAEFASNFYGTPRRPLEDLINQGKWVILEIELEGARQVRRTYPQALQIFVSPPSLEELELRIRQRGQDTEDAISKRLARAKVEIEATTEFDVQIINDDLNEAIHALEQALFEAS